MSEDELKRLLEASAAETRRAAESIGERMEKGFADVNARFADVNTRFADMNARFGAIETRIDESAAETQHQLGIATEATKSEVQIVAESVLQVREELGRTRAALNEKIEHTASETQSMIKFSHKEIDRRMTALEESQRTLEETVSDLQARMQRLESSTH